MESYCGINIYRDRDSLLAEQAITLLKDYYCLPHEDTPQQSYARAAAAYCEGDFEFAQRIYDYASTKRFMFASPCLSNAPMPGTAPVALPISCFLAYVPDDLKGLINHTSELRWLSVRGGGVGGHWSDVRSISDKAPGPIPFLHTVDADMTAYRQGKTRKGSYAAYLDISHPDIIEFINMRIPTGDANRKNLNIFNAVNLTDEFMIAVEKDLTFNLIDPSTKEIKDTIQARKLWEKLLITRARTGIPYLNFIDTANRHLPQTIKDSGRKIRGSNLCNEIHLPTDRNITAVCCLSSLNLEYYREWTDGQIVRDIVRLLDNIISFFIKHCPPELENAKRGAEIDRPLGLGAMGLHTLFQKEGIPFDSVEAFDLNEDIFKFIKAEAVKETLLLGEEKGECPSMKGTGRRNSHLLAIAPNANSSIIVGCSASVEPIKANAYTHRTRIGSHLIKNKCLENDLEKLGLNTDEIWSSIITHKGSIEHLDVSARMKDIYKTASDIDQVKLVEMAASRQKHICQGQSINLFFPNGASCKYVHDAHIKMWKLGGKGLYYYRTEATQRAENVSEKVKNTKREYFDECLSCQG